MGRDLKGKELGKGITQRRDGIYVARAVVKGSSICIYGKNYQKLKKDLEEQKLKILTGFDKAPDYTVEEWFEEWFDLYKTPHIKHTSVQPMKRRVKGTFLPYIGKIKLKDLKNRDLQIAVKELLDEGRIARSSIAEALNRLSDCFASAVNNRYMPSNPAFDLCVPFKEELWVEQRWLKNNEIKIFLQKALSEYPFFYPMLYVMIYTGLRIGEIGGLQWKDVNFKDKYIQVNQALYTEYKNGTKKMGFTTLKTPNSYRKVPFMGKVEDVLNIQKEQIDTLKATLGERYRSKNEYEDLVFVTTMGSPMIRHNAEKVVNKVVNSINYEEAINAKNEGREPIYFERVYPHALRHTFASLCYQAKFEAKKTQSLMGHAHLSTTMDIYTHLENILTSNDINNFNAVLEKQ